MQSWGININHMYHIHVPIIRIEALKFGINSLKNGFTYFIFTADYEMFPEYLNNIWRDGNDFQTSTPFVEFCDTKEYYGSEIYNLSHVR